MPGIRVLAVAAALTLLPAMGWPASAVTTTRYERLAYSGQVWAVTATSAQPLNKQQYDALGDPPTTAVRTVYRKLPYFATVYAVSTFDDSPATTLTEAITYAQYRVAGYPPVPVVPWLAGAGLVTFKWPTSSEIFVDDVNANLHKLTYAEWTAAGSPAPRLRTDEGVIRMSWDTGGNLLYMCDIAGGRGGRLTYAQWVGMGSPSPATVMRTANDLVFKSADPPGLPNPMIMYMGPEFIGVPGSPVKYPLLGEDVLLYSQWRAMGSPAPATASITYPERLYCDSAPTPALLRIN